MPPNYGMKIFTHWFRLILTLHEKQIEENDRNKKAQIHE